MGRIQNLHVGLPQAGDGSDILPIAAETVSVHAAVITQQCGNDILAEVVLTVGIVFVLGEVLFQDIPVEDINAHGSQVALGVLRLFLEFADAVILVRNHQTKARGFAPRHFHNGNRELGVLLFVEAQEISVILLADLVAGQDDDVLRVITVNEGNVLVNCVGSALVPVRASGLLVGRQHMDAAMQAVKVPRLAVADVFIQDQRLILGQDANGVNIRVDTVGQRKVDDTVLTAERNRRLSQLLGQRVEARTLAASQDHCDHFFCHNCSPLKLVYLHGPHLLRVAAGTALTHQTFTIPLPVFWAWLFLPLWAF